MPGQVTLTFKNFAGLDLSAATKIAMPARKNNLPGEETILRTALGIAAGAPSAGLLRSLINMVTPPFGVLKVAGSIPGARIRSPVPDFTVSDGLSASAGAAALNFGAGGGVYFWNKAPDGEVGLYGSLSVGIITNIGASIGVQLGFLFGPAPSTLGGDSITVAVDVDIGGGAIAGMLVITPPPGGMWPPSPAALAAWTPEIEGVGFGLSVGISALPVSVSVMPSHTWLHPIDPRHPIVV